MTAARVESTAISRLLDVSVTSGSGDLVQIVRIKVQHTDDGLFEVVWIDILDTSPGDGARRVETYASPAVALARAAVLITIAEQDWESGMTHTEDEFVAAATEFLRAEVMD